MMTMMAPSSPRARHGIGGGASKEKKNKNSNTTKTITTLNEEEEEKDLEEKEKKKNHRRRRRNDGGGFGTILFLQKIRIPKQVYFLPLLILVLKHLWMASQMTTTTRMNTIDNKSFQQQGLNPPPPPLSLSRLSSPTSFWRSQTCPKGLVYVSNVNQPTTSSRQKRKTRRIPKIVHQTAKSRCVTPAFYEISNQWKFGTNNNDDDDDGWEYYFHDDEAIERLLYSDLFSEFPNLIPIWRNCVTSGTLKADLWRYLVLWVYGGVYADFDTAPNLDHFFPNTTISDTDDGFFVVEMYHVLSQWFMAVSPRHPLMHYAIQHSLLNLLEAPDTLQMGAQFKTGPHALHSAFIQFRQDVGIGVDPAKPGFKPVSSGIFLGTNNRSITVVGVAEQQNHYVQRMAIKQGVRQRDYKKMGMKHFSQYTKGGGGETSGISCMTAILNDIQ